MRKFLIVLCAAATLLFSGYCLFYKLGAEPFQDYDEATYAEVTHESIAHGNLSSLTFLNQPYFRKPPLLFWLTTTSSHIFSDPEFADRFPSALAGLLAIVLVALVCIEAGAGVWTGLIAAGILATTAAWMEFARDVRFDNLVALFIVAAFYAGVRTLRDSRWFAVVGIMLALAVLAKSVMAVFGVIAVLAVLVHGRGLTASLRDRQLWIGVGAFVLVALPWHLYMTLTYGAAFWHSYIGMEVIGRASANLFPHGGNPTNAQYVGYLLSNVSPWFHLFVIALASTPFVMWRMTRKIRAVFIAAGITALSVLVVAFAAKTKAFGYLVPMYPFTAVMVALWGREVWRRATFIQPFLIALTIVLFACAAALTRYEALHLDPYYSYELSQAYQEQAVAAIIHAAPNPEVYTYGGYSDLGSIYYYSRLPDTKNPFILLWNDSSEPSATSTAFILATSSLSSLSVSFPHYHFTQNYSGTLVSLFTVTN